MALSDPQSIKIGGVTIPLPRVSTGKNESEYKSEDGLTELLLSSQYGARTRRVLRANVEKITADPFIPAQNVKVGMSCYTVFDLPPAGYTAAEQLAVFAGLNELATATSSTVMKALLGGQS